MSIKKQYLKNRPHCKVTFRVSKDAANAAKTIHLVGDFNEWNPQATPMNALKTGEFTAMVELDTGTPEYQFRYLCDGHNWINDDEADGYATNGMDGENFIVRV
jgi:1,4-alpha-glucan branching enzyme